MAEAFEPKIAASIPRNASFRTTGLTLSLATPLLLVTNPIVAQEQLTSSFETRYGRAPIAAPVGHRQPRTADVPQGAKSGTDLLDERETAALNRRLIICRGC